MKNVSIKIDDIIVEQLDFLVKKGKYKSRNEALRSMIKNSIEKEMSTIKINEMDIENINKMVAYFKKERVSLTISSKKTAVDLVNEGRER